MCIAEALLTATALFRRHLSQRPGSSNPANSLFSVDVMNLVSALFSGTFILSYLVWLAEFRCVKGVTAS